MTYIDIFFIGVGLAIDACCVCTSNGLVYKPKKMVAIKLALLFAIFQGVMPLIGYFGVGLFDMKLFEYSHIVALVLLSAIGVKMIYESLGEEGQEDQQEDGEFIYEKSLTLKMMLVQGISTSIDALSVGIAMNQVELQFMVNSVLIIAVITLLMCLVSVKIGIEIGTRFNMRAGIIGGLVLVVLGMKIFITGM